MEPFTKRIARLLWGQEDAEEGPNEVGRTGSERREFARVNVELVVSMSYASLADVVRCKTLDISHGGVFIMTREVRPEGTGVRVQLEIGEHRLDLAGVVVRSIPAGSGAPAGLGVMFTNVSPGQKVLLDAIVARKADGSVEG